MEGKDVCVLTFHDLLETWMEVFRFRGGRLIGPMVTEQRELGLLEDQGLEEAAEGLSPYSLPGPADAHRQVVSGT